MREATITGLLIRDYTDFVACPQCGGKGGEFIRLEVLVKSTQGDKTFPAEVKVHLTCFAGWFPLKVLERRGVNELTVVLPCGNKA